MRMVFMGTMIGLSDSLSYSANPEGLARSRGRLTARGRSCIRVIPDLRLGRIWQSRAVRGSRLRIAIGVLGTVAAIGGEALALQGGRTASSALLDLAIGLTYLHGGLAIWAHDPANRTGRLMTGVGLAWFIGTLDFSPIPIVQDLGIAFEDTFVVILVALVLAYPTGQLDRRVDRIGVAIIAVVATAINILYGTSLAISPDKTVGLYIGLSLATLSSALVISRWLAAPSRARRDLLPVLVAGLVFLAALVINIVRRIAVVPDD